MVCLHFVCLLFYCHNLRINMRLWFWLLKIQGWWELFPGSLTPGCLRSLRDQEFKRTNKRSWCRDQQPPKWYDWDILTTQQLLATHIRINTCASVSNMTFPCIKCKIHKNTNTKCLKTQHVLYFWKAGGSRISIMIIISSYNIVSKRVVKYWPLN